MAKGYWIGHVEITDLEGYKAYVPLSTAALAAFGGEILIRGGPSTVVEGKIGPRTVMVEFPSLETAKACYDSELYQKAKAVRTANSDADIVIVEGV